MFHIIASDLDGTLLAPNQQITSFAKKTLQLITNHNKNNIHFVFATGRHYKNVIKIRNKLKIKSYMITSNGARIHNTHGKMIAVYNINKKIAADLIKIVYYDPKIITNIFKNNEWLINRQNKINQKNNLQENNITCRIYSKNMVTLNGIGKIYFTSNDCQKLLLLEKKLHEKWGHHINISFSLPTCLEVMPRGVSKGQALKKVAKLLGYQLKDCIAFGDGMNDQEMLSMTGKGCIMYNAQQRLKDTLPYLEIIGSNKDDAVPHYLQYIFSQKLI